MLDAIWGGVTKLTNLLTLPDTEKSAHTDCGDTHSARDTASLRDPTTALPPYLRSPYTVGRLSGLKKHEDPNHWRHTSGTVRRLPGALVGEGAEAKRASSVRTAAVRDVERAGDTDHSDQSHTYVRTECHQSEGVKGTMGKPLATGQYRPLNTINNPRPGISPPESRAQTYSRKRGANLKGAHKEASQHDDRDNALHASGQASKRQKTSHSSPVMPYMRTSFGTTETYVDISDNEDPALLDRNRAGAGAVAGPSNRRHQRARSAISTAKATTESEAIPLPVKKSPASSTPTLVSSRSLRSSSNWGFGILEDAQQHSNHFVLDPPTESELGAKQRNPNARNDVATGKTRLRNRPASPNSPPSKTELLRDNSPSVHDNSTSRVSDDDVFELFSNACKNPNERTDHVNDTKRQNVFTGGARMWRDVSRSLDEGPGTEMQLQQNQRLAGGQGHSSRSEVQRGRVCPTRKLPPSGPVSEACMPALNVSTRLKDRLKDTSKITTSKSIQSKQDSSNDELSGPATIGKGLKKMGSALQAKRAPSSGVQPTLSNRNRAAQGEKPDHVSDSEPESKTEAAHPGRKSSEKEPTAELSHYFADPGKSNHSRATQVDVHRRLGDHDSALQIEETPAVIDQPKLLENTSSKSVYRPQKERLAERDAEPVDACVNELDSVPTVASPIRRRQSDGQNKQARPLAAEPENVDELEASRPNDRHQPTQNELATDEPVKAAQRMELPTADMDTPPSEIEKMQRLRRTGRSYKPKQSVLVDVEDAQAAQRKPWYEEQNVKPWLHPLTWPLDKPRQVMVNFDDLVRLDEGEFLNDNIVQFELRRIEDFPFPCTGQVYFFNTFFYDSLMKTPAGKVGFNYDAVKKWTRKVDIFSFPYIIVPVNSSAHWYVFIICNAHKLVESVNLDDEHFNPEPSQGDASETASAGVGAPSVDHVDDLDLASMNINRKSSTSPSSSVPEASSQSTFKVPDSDDELATVPSATTRPAAKRKPGKQIDPNKPLVIALDSLGMTHAREVSNLKRYLVAEAKDKKGRNVDMKDILGTNAKGVPTQTNMSDCGIFLCGYVTKFLQNPRSFVEKVCSREMDENNDFDGYDPHRERRAIRNRILSAYQIQKKHRKALKARKRKAREASESKEASTSPAKKAKKGKESTTTSVETIDAGELAEEESRRRTFNSSGGVVDHGSDPGSSLTGEGTTHRSDRSIVQSGEGLLDRIRDYIRPTDAGVV
ncbi:hypothetical protein CAC42_3452 [Sphaceloma murrayae]|uniref:Ubiquitin-like protease family profile domain-containing protein n=1 Tax=Sphaceloma murrayae TaxID=2082308 RepID=A0A2K1R1E6_9PEZI|nr:hypothetical protein CAC42_3452 [Sphaceloma murrayae]